MIHIIDPRVSQPMPALCSGAWTPRRRGKGRPTDSRYDYQRYLPDRLVFSSFLVAIRLEEGKYRVIKTRFHKVPKRPVSLARLLVMVAETMTLTDNVFS